ncbi:MAG: hypothetical protein ACLQF0_01365 [Dissulfurispiraceae bacterium]
MNTKGYESICMTCEERGTCEREPNEHNKCPFYQPAPPAPAQEKPKKTKTNWAAVIRAMPDKEPDKGGN